MNERDAMRRALALAWKGWGRVHPNPLVGAVMLGGGKKIGEGYHAEFGGPHAEIVAMESAGNAKGATLVVTLEPCNHRGKTPPCSDALVRAGIRRLVYAIADPHVEAQGGAARLRDAGVEVEGGLLAENAAAQNALFLWAETRADIPFVALKLATSIDGCIADEKGRSQWISGEAAREWVHWLRAGFAAVAVGHATARSDAPQLTVRGPVEPRVPHRRLVFARGDAPTPRGLEAVDGDDLRGALRRLREEGVRSLLVEGGGALAGSLLAGGFVDRVYWIQAPLWLGKGTPAFGDRPGVSLQDVKRWRVTERRALGDDTLLVIDRELCSPGL